jgi:hypothetical protein
MSGGLENEEQPDDAALRTVLDGIIPEAFRQHEGSMVTKWVLLAEVIDKDGDRGLWTMAPSGLKPWESVGMLAFAQQTEQAQMVADLGGAE